MQLSTCSSIWSWPKTHGRCRSFLFFCLCTLCCHSRAPAGPERFDVGQLLTIATQVYLGSREEHRSTVALLVLPIPSPFFSASRGDTRLFNDDPDRATVSSVTLGYATMEAEGTLNPHHNVSPPLPRATSVPRELQDGQNTVGVHTLLRKRALSGGSPNPFCLVSRVSVCVCLLAIAPPCMGGSSFSVGISKVPLASTAATAWPQLLCVQEHLSPLPRFGSPLPPFLDLVTVRHASCTYTCTWKQPQYEERNRWHCYTQSRIVMCVCA